MGKLIIELLFSYLLTCKGEKQPVLMGPVSIIPFLLAEAGKWL